MIKTYSWFNLCVCVSLIFSVCIHSPPHTTILIIIYVHLYCDSYCYYYLEAVVVIGGAGGAIVIVIGVDAVLIRNRYCGYLYY